MGKEKAPIEELAKTAKALLWSLLPMERAAEFTTRNLMKIQEGRYKFVPALPAKEVAEVQKVLGQDVLTCNQMTSEEVDKVKKKDKKADKGKKARPRSPQTPSGRPRQLATTVSSWGISPETVHSLPRSRLPMYRAPRRLKTPTLLMTGLPKRDH